MRGFVRATALLSGLALYGFSMALMVRAGLGLDPWDVFHQGISRHTGWTIGTASAVVGVAVLLAWIPLRNRPGVGTLANVVVIAVTVDAALAILPAPTALPVRIAMMLGAVLLNAVPRCSHRCRLGPGPRRPDDGAVARTGARFGWCAPQSRQQCSWRGLLGGTVGVGTVVTRSASGRWCN
jgi:uncharacterized membrane protein YczE